MTGNFTNKCAQGGLLQHTCFKIVDSFEVADKKISRDDDGGVAQNIEEQAEEPHVLPAAQQWSVFSVSKHRRQNAQRRTPTQTEEKTSYITLTTVHTSTYLYWNKTATHLQTCSKCNTGVFRKEIRCNCIIQSCGHRNVPVCRVNSAFLESSRSDPIPTERLCVQSSGRHKLTPIPPVLPDTSH